LQVQSKFTAHFPTRIINQTIKWKNYEEANNQWDFVLKSIIEMFEGNEIMWYSST
jgi:hypothetical protein